MTKRYSADALAKIALKEIVRRVRVLKLKLTEERDISGAGLLIPLRPSPSYVRKAAAKLAKEIKTRKFTELSSALSTNVPDGDCAKATSTRYGVSVRCLVQYPNDGAGLARLDVFGR